jgi:hypothetical protein
MSNTARILCYSIGAAAAASLSAITAAPSLDSRGWAIVILSGLAAAGTAAAAYADKGPSK